ncbi:thiolase-like protein [Aspergillus heteromorphus CBS 117.55]|uniref:Thiolase-like protein n=1 Tax=Aspergillus heteromorphus CBS 117.55 TaxID=1448321 RepID=A0A317WS30_9EURO|nr:thiolase-like protein [Aspergillus heteromorphus CBS 117.55]PWY89256.1 thiolase-like protein [Aspergillus heteromorphus CBS 117.55]
MQGTFTPISVVAQFWNTLIDKGDGLGEVPKSRYNMDSFYHPTKDGCTRVEYAFMDPQQRLLLELVWGCFENAGGTNWEGNDMGAIYPQTIDRFHALGTANYALANRISYEYDFRRPSLAIGACSSAIVAGSNLILTPTMTTSLSNHMVLSLSGVCQTFDANADGYGRDNAILANDPIRAVIRSTAVNIDGKMANITVPSIRLQESLIRSAYCRAGIDDLSETAFIECHGTGTVTGDAVETTAVSNCFKPKGAVISAVDPNFGHSEGVSGITSFIEAILSNVFEANLIVSLEPMQWPADRRERVSISGFGVGGANAHVILDSASELCCAPPASRPSGTEGPRLLVVSARDATSLHSHSGVRREHLLHRVFCVASPAMLLEPTMFQKSVVKTSLRLSFVFTGQGAQWLGMGKELMEKYKGFRADILKLEDILKGIKDPPSYQLRGK